MEKQSERLNPAPSETVQRFKFHGCFRKEGESVTVYDGQTKIFVWLSSVILHELTLEDMLGN